jgi:hypothetical protein
MVGTRAIEHHPVWDELREMHVLAVREEAARALFDDVRPAWERAGTSGGSVGVPDPVVAFALCLQAAVRWATARALFDDVRPAWEDAPLG